MNNELKHDTNSQRSLFPTKVGNSYRDRGSLQFDNGIRNQYFGHMHREIIGKIKSSSYTICRDPLVLLLILQL